MIVAIVPGYNPGPKLEKVLKETRRYVDEIIFVDDGSTDDSARIANDLGVVLIQYKNNLGKGFALRTGVERAFALNFKELVFIDSDGQHLPSEIPLLLNDLRSGSDLAIGRRDRMKSSMPHLRRFSNTVSSWLISLAARKRLEDTQCGFRAVKRPVLEKIKLIPGKYETETRFLIDSCRAGFKVSFVSISTVYDPEIKSYYRNLRDSLRIAKSVIGRYFSR